MRITMSSGLTKVDPYIMRSNGKPQKYYGAIYVPLSETQTIKKNKNLTLVQLTKIAEDSYSWQYCGKPAILVTPSGYYAKSDSRNARHQAWIISDILAKHNIKKMEKKRLEEEFKGFERVMPKTRRTEGKLMVHNSQYISLAEMKKIRTKKRLTKTVTVQDVSDAYGEGAWMWTHKGGSNPPVVVTRNGYYSTPTKRGEHQAWMVADVIKKNMKEVES